MQGNLMSRRNFVGAAAATAATVAAFSLTGCCSNGSSDAKSDAKEDKAEAKALSGTITAVGSTALQPLCEAAAEQFMEKNSGVQITVQGGGSGQGITQITQGAVQIGNSDVFAEAKVKDTADLKKIADNKVCIVGMGPIVNKDVTVDDLTIDQLKSIFTGEVTNWKEVGGDDAEIVLIGREAGSGTRDGFESITKTEDKCKYGQELTSTGDVITTVSQNPNAIGYASLSAVKDSVKALTVGGVAPTEATVKDVKALSVGKVKPTEETVKDGSYVVQRPFVLVTKEGKALSDTAQKFFDYVTSADASQIISDAGAVPVK